MHSNPNVISDLIKQRLFLEGGDNSHVYMNANHHHSFTLILRLVEVLRGSIGGSGNRSQLVSRLLPFWLPVAGPTPPQVMGQKTSVDRW